MNFTLIGLYGIFLVFVGMAGNQEKLKALFTSDIKGFIPWAVAIVILKSLNDVDSLKPAVKPFIFLAVLTFVLKNWNTLADQANQISGGVLNIKGVKSNG